MKPMTDALALWNSLDDSYLEPSDVERSLTSPFDPVWQMDQNGIVTAVNSLALWLWGAPHVARGIDSLSVLGESFFVVVARNEGRIPNTKETLATRTEFWAAVFRLEHHFSAHLASPLAVVRAAQPSLQRLYQNLDMDDLDHVSVFPMTLVSPSSSEEPNLRFEVMISGIISDDHPAGFLVQCGASNNNTSFILEKWYNILTYGGNDKDNYVRYLNDGGGVTHGTKMKEKDTSQVPSQSEEGDTWRNLLGPLLNYRQVEQVLKPAYGESIRDLVGKRRLIALPTREGEVVYPGFQFTSEGQVLNEVGSVLRAFSEAIGDEEILQYTTASWFKSGQRYLEGMTPMQWIEQKRSPRRLKEAANITAAHLAQ